MISVVLASCEGARFIREQLESILVQLGPEDEVIVSDDHSLDRTVAEVQSIGDARIRVLSSTQRVGFVRNFDRALQQVRGSHVFFSDQDDVWLPGKVSHLMQMLERVACAASDATVVDERLNVLHESFFGFRRAHRFTARAIFWRPPIIGATMACRAEYLRSMRPLPRGVSHDIWLTFNAALRGTLGVLPNRLILYRRHGAVASLTGTYKRRSLSVMLTDRSLLLFWTAMFAAGLGGKPLDLSAAR